MWGSFFSPLSLLTIIAQSLNLFRHVNKQDPGFDEGVDCQILQWMNDWMVESITNARMWSPLNAISDFYLSLRILSWPIKWQKKNLQTSNFQKGYHYFFNYLSGIGGVKFLGVKIITVQVTFGDAASVVEWINSFDHGLKAFNTKITDYEINLILLF